MSDKFKNAPPNDLKQIIQSSSDHELESILINQNILDASFYQNLTNDSSWIESFFSSNTYALLPIQLLWLVTSFVSLGVAALGIFAGISSIVGVLFLGLTYYYFKQANEKLLQNKKHISLTQIKIDAMNEFLARQALDWESTAANQYFMDITPIGKKESIKVGTLLSLNLLFSFWGIKDLLLIVGLLSTSSMLAGPIGLAIAAGISILIGIVYAVHHYHYQQKIAPIKSSKKSLDDECKAKHTALTALPLNLNGYSPRDDSKHPNAMLSQSISIFSSFWKPNKKNQTKTPQHSLKKSMSYS